MTDTSTAADPAGSGTPSGGSYDLLRRRLRTTVRAAVDAAGAIDERRTSTFGSVALRLTSSDRLRTDLAARPRDMVRVGELVLLGYRVAPELAEATPEHVFGLFEARPGDELVPLPLEDPRNFLAEAAFREAFTKLHKFYGKARFVDLRRTPNQLLAAFRIGDRLDDVAVLRWAVDEADVPRFVDSRGERDYTWPEAHDLRWVACTREDQRAGAHPTVSVLDEVFVGFRGGRLQLRVEDGTPGGRVELDEPVEVPGQSLADVEVGYAEVGEELAIRVELYAETPRYYLFGRRTRSGTRVDALGAASRLLPGGDGVVFPGGYHLATTGTRLFDTGAEGSLATMVFEEMVPAPNGEDLLYVFHDRESGDYLLAPYNRVRREIAQIIPCHGFAVFGDGRMLIFRGAPEDAELSRVHPVQWWETPFTDPEWVAEATPGDDDWVRRVGNADLVAGLADAYDVGQLAEDAEPSERTWEAIIVAARRALDTHLWLADPEAVDLHDRLREIVETAGLLVDEFVKVRRQRADAAAALVDAGRAARRVMDDAERATDPTDVVAALGGLRRQRGEASLLTDVAEIDDTAVAALLDDLDTAMTGLAERAAAVLDDDTAFDGFRTRLEQLGAEGDAAPDAATVDGLLGDVAEVTGDLDAVVDAVSALDAGDPTARTRIVRRIADVTAAANQARARLDGRRSSLRSSESEEAFDAEVALLEQSLTGAVTGVDTPDAVDAELARLLVNLERIETRYGDEPERIERLVELRDRLNETFGARRSELVDARARRTRRLVDAAERLLATVVRRASDAADEAEIAGFFAADQMVARVRSLAEELDELGEAGRAAEVRNELTAAAEEARRRVRDTADLVDDDGAVVFGGFRFAPNHQPFELVLSPAEGRIEAVITGTEFRRDVTDRLGAFADLLDRSHPSEQADVARAEYLAWAVIDRLRREGRSPSAVAAVPADLAAVARATAEHRHGEGYELGVHDHDAARIVAAVAGRGNDDPVLAHAGGARAGARLLAGAWSADHLAAIEGRVRAARAARDRVGVTDGLDRLAAELAIDAVLPGLDVGAAVAVLVDDLGREAGALGSPTTVDDLLRRAEDALGRDGWAEFAEALGGVDDAHERFRLAVDWLGGLTAPGRGLEVHAFDVAEAAATLAAPDIRRRSVAHAGAVVVDGLVSDHRRIVDGSLTVRFDELADRVGSLLADMEQRWPTYLAARRALVDELRDELDLDAHRPQVMAGFVRNRLIDRALLPLIGANLGRQIGTTDATDLARSGLLVLTSPPGYGKTTLMAWLADRLGMLMVKVNGPALGVATTSLDPADAPDAAARAEVEKINLALRMGRNVMLFVDDVQFTSPTLLSRFIPLADATRRIEGVVDGEAVTHDLRGRRFAVVMAGNPYSTGGARFELPDMLVNRADVHNLGDVADEHADDFALSYLENSVTACADLAPYAARLVDDVEAILAMARGRRPTSSDGLDHRWDGGDLDTAVRLVGLLDRAQETVMEVNAAYVASAAMADEDRVAPPFLLQGSYRNMARIASRVVGAMRPEELDGVVDDHYQSEAQTLTDRAEQNLLALGALRGRLDDAEADRWRMILDRRRGAATDPAVDAVAALDRIADALGASDRAGGAGSR